MKKFLKTATLLIITSLVITTMNNCNKTNPGVVAVENQNDFTELIEKSKAMQEHVLTFKTKMKYYHDNPNLKSGGEKYTAPDAVLELESLINFTFCYTDIECNKKTFVTSEIIMPLDDLEKISDPKLTEVYYNKIIDTIQAQMNRTNYTNMKLLLVDLAQTGTDSNGDAIVSVGTLIGNERSITQTDEIGYWFGGLLGNCQHDSVTIGAFDATTELQGDLYFINFPATPPNIIRKKTSIYHVYPSSTPWDNYLVPVGERDNYLDSKLFSADVAYGVIDDDTRCLTDSAEMPFYRNHYNQLIHDADSLNEELELTELAISYFEVFDNNENHEKIWHELDIWLGNVWYVNNYNWPVEDITTYEQ